MKVYIAETSQNGKLRYMEDPSASSVSALQGWPFTESSNLRACELLLKRDFCSL